MRTISTKKSIHNLFTLKDEINLKPIYQRYSPTWSRQQEKQLINSIIFNIYIPPIILREIKHKKFRYEVIDGQQRLLTIFKFKESRLYLQNDMPKINSQKKQIDISGKKYSQIPTRISTLLFDDKDIDIVILADSTDAQATHQFLMLNNGTPLTMAEIRNSIPSRFSNLCRQLAENDLFKWTAVNNKRCMVDTLCAQLLILEHDPNVDHLKHQKIIKYFKDYRKKAFPQDVYNNCLKKIHILEYIFEGKKRRYLNKGNIINAYFIINKLLENRISLHDEKDCNNLLDWFENNIAGINAILRKKDILWLRDFDKRMIVIENAIKAKDFPFHLPRIKKGGV